jgi:hypothetical protein
VWINPSFLIFEISDLYDFGLGFISSLPNILGIKGFVVVVDVWINPCSKGCMEYFLVDRVLQEILVKRTFVR